MPASVGLGDGSSTWLTDSAPRLRRYGVRYLVAWNDEATPRREVLIDGTREGL